MNVYGLYDPAEPGEIRYVGITKNPVGSRLKAHLAETAASKERTHKVHWIAALNRDLRIPSVRCLAIIENHEASRTEQLAIAAYRKAGHRLTNGTEGGEQIVYTEESRAKLSAALKAAWARPGEKERKSAAMRVGWERPGVKAKQRAVCKAALAGPETKAKKSAAAKVAWARHGTKTKHRAAMASPESRAKRSAAQKDRWACQKARTKQSVVQKMVQARPEVKAKKSAAALVTWARPDAKEKMRAAIKSWANRKRKQKEAGLLNAIEGVHRVAAVAS